jgi:hypothetical protein
MASISGTPSRCQSASTWGLTADVARDGTTELVIKISNECRLGGDQFESINRSHQRGTRKDRSLEMNIHTTPDRIDYQLTRAFVAIELQSQDRIDQAIDRLAIRLLVQA